jgi:hypothetical protein
MAQIPRPGTQSTGGWQYDCAVRSALRPLVPQRTPTPRASGNRYILHDTFTVRLLSRNQPSNRTFDIFASLSSHHQTHDTVRDTKRLVKSVRTVTCVCSPTTTRDRLLSNKTVPPSNWCTRKRPRILARSSFFTETGRDTMYRSGSPWINQPPLQANGLFRSSNRSNFSFLH